MTFFITKHCLFKVWLAQLVRFLPCNHKVPGSIPALPRFEYLYDLFYHQTLPNSSVVDAVGIRSLPSNHKVPGSTTALPSLDVGMTLFST